MKKVLIVVLVAMLVCAAFGCAAPEGTAETTGTPAEETGAAETGDSGSADGKADEDIFIGVMAQDLSLTMGSILHNAMEEYAAEKYPNVKYTLVDGQGDAVRQIEQMESLVSQGVDVILLNAQDGDLLVEATKKTIDAGIPVVTVGADLTQQVGQYWCGSPNIQSGVLQMEHAVEKLGGKGNLAIIRGPLGHEAEIGRVEGYMQVLADYPDIEIVYDQTAEWDKGRAMSMIENLLQTDIEIDGIIAQNDDMAMGAREAVEAAGMKDKIFIIGCDMNPEATVAVRDGRLDATIYQDVIGQGVGAFELGVQIARGNEVESLSIPYVLITKENVDEYAYDLK